MERILSMAFNEGSCVFKFYRCLFEYKGQEFMLYAGNEKEYMSIDTVVSNAKEEDKAFELIHEFLYLFGWKNNASFHFLDASMQYPGNRELLLKRKIPLLRYPRRMYQITELLFISALHNSNELKKALALYNDADNQDLYHRFICLYKILDIPIAGKTRNPEEWINDNKSNIKIPSNSTMIDKTFHEIENLGAYLRDECRNALAHIHRKEPSKSIILSFRFADFKRISIANTILEYFVIYFIENELGGKQMEEQIVNVIQTDKEKMM